MLFKEYLKESLKVENKDLKKLISEIGIDLTDEDYEEENKNKIKKIKESLEKSNPFKLSGNPKKIQKL